MAVLQRAPRSSCGASFFRASPPVFDPPAGPHRRRPRAACFRRSGSVATHRPACTISGRRLPHTPAAPPGAPRASPVPSRHRRTSNERQARYRRAAGAPRSRRRPHQRGRTRASPPDRRDRGRRRRVRVAALRDRPGRLAQQADPHRRELPAGRSHRQLRPPVRRVPRAQGGPAGGRREQGRRRRHHRCRRGREVAAGRLHLPDEHQHLAVARARALQPAAVPRRQ